MHIGFQFEFTGTKRQTIAIALMNYFENKEEIENSDNEESDNLSYKFNDSENRIWVMNFDEKISPEMTYNNDIILRKPLKSENKNYNLYKNKIKTPMLESTSVKDMQIIRDMFLILKTTGCVINDTCSMHIYFDRPTNEKVLCIYLKKIMETQYEQFKEFNTNPIIIEKYAKPYTVEFDYKSMRTLDDILKYIKESYKEVIDENGNFSCKNFIINFESCIYDNTVEFNGFNGTLDFTDVQKAINYIIDVMIIKQ